MLAFASAKCCARGGTVHSSRPPSSAATSPQWTRRWRSSSRLQPRRCACTFAATVRKAARLTRLLAGRQCTSALGAGARLASCGRAHGSAPGTRTLVFGSSRQQRQRRRLIVELRRAAAAALSCRPLAQATGSLLQARPPSLQLQRQPPLQQQQQTHAQDRAAVGPRPTRPLWWLTTTRQRLGRPWIPTWRASLPCARGSGCFEVVRRVEALQP